MSHEHLEGMSKRERLIESIEGLNNPASRRAAYRAEGEAGNLTKKKTALAKSMSRHLRKKISIRK